MTNSDRLQEIRERAEKATPGPWEPHCVAAQLWSIILPNDRLPGRVIADFVRSNNNKGNDAIFACNSREDIPYLLQLVTEQQREIERHLSTIESLSDELAWIKAAY